MIMICFTLSLLLCFHQPIPLIPLIPFPPWLSKKQDIQLRFAIFVWLSVCMKKRGWGDPTCNNNANLSHPYYLHIQRRHHWHIHTHTHTHAYHMIRWFWLGFFFLRKWSTYIMMQGQTRHPQPNISYDAFIMIHYKERFIFSMVILLWNVTWWSSNIFDSTQTQSHCIQKGHYLHRSSIKRSEFGCRI